MSVFYMSLLVLLSACDKVLAIALGIAAKVVFKFEDDYSITDLTDRAIKKYLFERDIVKKFNLRTTVRTLLQRNHC